MKVLSLFDGISCGRIALERAGIPVEAYHASEIEKNAIKVSQRAYPDIVQIGDVTKVSGYDYQDFDMLIGGSPCTDLSVYKLDRGERDGLEGKQSSLFFQYERIFKEMKPKYFLLENVPMAQEWQDVITDILGVEPIRINSNLVSAADRKRLYWTNIPGIEQPEDKGIILRDIAQPAETVADKYWYDKPFVYNGDDKKVQCTIDISGHRNMKEVYNLNGKSNTLLADGAGGNRQKNLYQDGRCRKMTPLEYERCQTIPDNYSDCISDSARYSAIGNGWTVDIIAHIFSYIPEVTNEKI